jgi:ubiquinone/menaquinone biosynthesis C-methylase UbiE
MSEYRDNIKPGGADTGMPLNVAHRIDIARQYVSLEGKRILDCGCGCGEYLKVMEQYSENISGIEYEAAKVQRYYDAGGDRNKVRVGNVEQLEFEDNTFDFVFMNEVLDHVADQERALGEVSRVLKPGGVLAIFTPNRFYPFETHGVGLKANGRDISHLWPFIPWIPLSVGNRLFTYYARNYWPWELKRLVRGAGLGVVEQGYAWQTFENNTHRLPRVLALVAPVLRKLARLLEMTPVLKMFGVSLLVIARKPEAR